MFLRHGVPAPLVLVVLKRSPDLRVLTPGAFSTSICSQASTPFFPVEAPPAPERAGGRYSLPTRLEPEGSLCEELHPLGVEARQLFLGVGVNVEP